MTDPRIGTILDGRYKIVDELAAGGMGVVYRGERLGLGRGVAIKFLHAHIAADKAFRERFAREAQAMGQLQHPHCASVIDFGFHDQEPYVVMDLVAGESLRRLIERGRLPAWRALGIMRQILSGLAHAHGLGITHRDIKPDNVMVDAAGAFGDQVRILDFGLAKLRQTSSELTTGFVVGTPSYMAPEQTLALPVDERTDIYAAGIVLFEMLTGEKPFRADEAVEVLRMHREKPPPRLAQLAPDVHFSDELESALLQSLAKDPGHRFSSAAAFATALDHVPEAATRPGSAPPMITPSTPAPAVAHPGRPGAQGALGTAPTEWSQPQPGRPTGRPMEASPTEHLGTGQLEVMETDPGSGRGRNAARNRGRDLPGAAATVPGGGPTPRHVAEATRPDTGALTPFTYPSIDLPAGLRHADPPAGLRHASSDGMRAISAGMDATQPRAFSQAEPGRSRKVWIGLAAAAAVIGLLVVVGLLGDGGAPAGSTDGDELAAAGSAGEYVIEVDRPVEGGEDMDMDMDRDRAAGDTPAPGDEALPGEAGGEDMAGDGATAGDEPGTGDGADTTGTARSGDPARAGVKSANVQTMPSLEKARTLLAQGKTAQARNLLEKLSRQERGNAEVHYLLGKSYFKELWVKDGIDAYRKAIELDARYRNDAELIQSAVTGLANDSSHGYVSRFLTHDIGRPARSALQAMASGHYREEVRARAMRALRQLP